MTKAEFSTRLACRLDITKKQADMLLEEFMDAIMSNLQREKRVVIQGFGSFKLREYRPRTGRKPVSGEPFQISAKNKPLFHASKELLALINASERRIFVGKAAHASAQMETTV